MILNENQKELCEKIGYSFINLNLFEQALVHSSRLMEGKKNKYKSSDCIKNQQMEFLGDRLLGYIISDYLYKNHPNWRLEELHLNFVALVRKEACAEIAESIGLGKSLIMGKDENRRGGRLRKKILGDAMEALIAAIYLDSNLTKVKRIVIRLWHSKLINLDEAKLDPKGSLQKWTMQRGMKNPQYIEIKRDGPDHDPVFYMEVSLDNGLSAIGKEKSKRGAQQLAAESLLCELENK